MRSYNKQKQNVLFHYFIQLFDNFIYSQWLVPAYPGCPGPKAVKRLRVCVCQWLSYFISAQCATHKFITHVNVITMQKWHNTKLQEAPLSPRDRAMHRLS